MKSLSPLPFPGKIRLLFAIFGTFLPGNRAGSKVKGVESKFDKYYFIHTIPGQLPAATDHKGHFNRRNFKEISTGFSYLADFLGTIPNFLS